MSTLAVFLMAIEELMYDKEGYTRGCLTQAQAVQGFYQGYGYGQSA
jgi:hypothetical protein